MVRVFDALVALCFGVWLWGGIPWDGGVILRHGADPRRAALLLLIAAALLGSRTPLWERSLWLRLARRAARWLERPRARWAALGAAAAWAMAVGVAQALALRFPLFDVGIFHQIGWSLARFEGFNSTVSGAGNFLLDHLSPSLALLTPAFWLTGSSPLTLPLVQPLLIFGGAAAWVYLAARMPDAPLELRPKLAAATTVFILGFDSLWANLRWGFHENSVYFAAFSWGLAILYTHRIVRRDNFWQIVGLVLLMIAAGSKETALLSVAVFLAVWTAWQPKGFRAFGWVMAAFLVGKFVAFQQMPHPPDKNYFVRYYGYLGADLPTFAKNLMMSPGKVGEAVGWAVVAGYFFALLKPWLALPLWLRGRELLLALVIAPPVAMAALSTYPTLRETGFHYVLEIWPILALLTLIALARLGSIRWAWIWAAASLVMLGQDPWGSLREYIPEAVRKSELRRALAAIPIDASLSADDAIGFWASGRQRATQWPQLRIFDGCPDWIVVRAGADLGACEGLMQEAWSHDGWSGYRKASESTRPSESVGGIVPRRNASVGAMSTT